MRKEEIDELNLRELINFFDESGSLKSKKKKFSIAFVIFIILSAILCLINPALFSAITGPIIFTGTILFTEILICKMNEEYKKYKVKNKIISKKIKDYKIYKQIDNNEKIYQIKFNDDTIIHLTKYGAITYDEDLVNLLFYDRIIMETLESNNSRTDYGPQENYSEENEYSDDSDNVDEESIFAYTDLTAQKQIINEAIGREKELRLLIEGILSYNSSPIIIGEPGVGKSALVKGLVYKMQNGDVPDFLKNKKIYSIDVAELVRGSHCIGDFEERMAKFIESANKKNVIFFIDEIHQIIGVGKGSNGGTDGANILKPHIDNGHINIIGATTIDEYNEYILNDSAFADRFEKILLKEPTNDILYDIIEKHIKKLEEIYKVNFFTNENIKKIIINSLIELTADKNRIIFDKKNNPRLVLSILQKAFIKCLMDNNTTLTLQNIYDSINDTQRVHDHAKEHIIKKMKPNLQTEDSITEKTNNNNNIIKIK